MSAEAFVTKMYYSELESSSAPFDLSVFVSSESLMYAVFSDSFRRVVELCEINIPSQTLQAYDHSEIISLLVNNHMLTQKKFEKVNVCLVNQSFTLVPEAYAGDSNPKELLSFTTGINPVKTMKHKLNGMQLFYSVDADLVNYFEKIFPQSSLRHSAAVSISLLQSHHTFKETDLYLNICDGSIELAAKKQNALLFYNVFNYTTNEDVLYYLLFTMEQFKLDPLTTRLSIAAQRSVQDELIKSIRKYIKQVQFTVTDLSISMGGELSKLPQHYYFTLLNQHLCEL